MYIYIYICICIYMDIHIYDTTMFPRVLVHEGIHEFAHQQYVPYV